MMADFLLIVCEDEAAHISQSPRAMAEAIASRARFEDDLRRAQALRDCGRFRPSQEGKRVHRGRVDDGPFDDDGTTLAAYYWVTAPDIDAASRLAAQCPILPTDRVDVRPLMKGGIAPDKDTKPGKIFAFAVLGRGDSEDAWQGVMDRIDADTVGHFPADVFLGGNRLLPPRAGRRVVTRGEQRAVFDGPFLESKEIIGGVFFLRAMTIDDAVVWAAESRFVVHGVLEVRELWRS